MQKPKSLAALNHWSALLATTRLPGRLNVEQTATLLGFQPHDIATLAGAKLLRPLGSPAKNSPKYFAAVEVEAHAQDVKWLGIATREVRKHWEKKNQARTPVEASEPIQPSKSSGAKGVLGKATLANQPPLVIRPEIRRILAAAGAEQGRRR